MKLCFPVTRDLGLDSRVSSHFGSAPAFVLVDTASNDARTLSNTRVEHEHGACRPLDGLAGEEIDAVVVGGIGPGALQKLRGAGIAVLRAGAPTVRGCLDGIAKGEAPLFADREACASHGHEHGGLARPALTAPAGQQPPSLSAAQARAARRPRAAAPARGAGSGAAGDRGGPGAPAEPGQVRVVPPVDSGAGELRHAGHSRGPRARRPAGCSPVASDPSGRAGILVPECAVAARRARSHHLLRSRRPDGDRAFLPGARLASRHGGKPAAERKEIAHHRLITGRAAEHGLGNRLATNLDRVAWKRDQGELATSIGRPVENMPRFGLDGGQTEAVIAYLLRSADPKLGTATYRVRFSKREAARGLVFETRCGGCHRTLSAASPLGKGSAGPNLSGVFTTFFPPSAPGNRLWTPLTLERWLENPRALRPRTAMRPVRLEAKDFRILIEELGGEEPRPKGI